MSASLGGPLNRRFTVFENNNLCKTFGNRVHNRYFGNSQLGCWSSSEKICHVNRYILQHIRRPWLTDSAFDTLCRHFSLCYF